MDLLRKQAAAQPSKIAIRMADTGRAVTYAALDAAADRIAGLFQRQGLRPGDTIALLLDNDPSAPELWWGARRAGLYYVPLGTRLRGTELAFIVQDSGARMLIASPGQAALAEDIEDAIEPGYPLEIMLLGDAFEALAEEIARTPLEAAPVTGRELIYSSGTTGRPKGIRRDLAPSDQADRLPALEIRMRSLFELDADTVYLSVTPLYHATGRFVSRVIETGGTAVILPKFEPPAALAAIETYRVTHSQWVPTMFTRLLALSDAERSNHDLSTHRFALHAAAPCPEAVKRAMLEWWGPIVHEYYGGTENAGVTFIRAEEWLSHPGSVGRPVTGKVHILAEDGSERELPPGEIGAIYFEGGVPFTYLNDEDRGAAVTGKGYTTYGDLGHLDAEGYLYISDRRSDLIISGGVNVYPKEVELLLESHPAVREAAVIGVRDSEYGQRVMAVVCADDCDGLADVLIAFCRSRLSGIKCPRSVAFVDALPRNDNGKLLKRALRDLFDPAPG